MSGIAKNLVLVLVTSAPVIEVSKKDDILLEKVLCIYYLMLFKKNEMQALINSGSKINVITPTHLAKLGLKIHFINVKA